MTEEQKAADRAKPVSSTPVPGTPWYVHHSGHQWLVIDSSFARFLFGTWKYVNCTWERDIGGGQGSLMFVGLAVYEWDLVC